ncbi:MAG: HAD-IIIA family hydrolase [Verrucomicrobia bacterium]|nr:HAD-IIIA family hydrolase [Verrucomicrobiota bacterium]
METPQGSELTKRPAIFFDRDGVVNRSPGGGYITRWQDFVINEGIGEALRLCRSRGFWTVLVTSQRCVAKGLITLEELHSLHDEMQHSLGAAAQFDSIHVFTGLPGTESLEKPNPGLIVEATEVLPIDLKRSWLIGDADRDIVMAQRAGVPSTVRVRTDHRVGVEATFTVDSIEELIKVLEQQLSVV